MPTRPIKANDINTMNSADIINTALDASGEFAKIVPRAVKPGDVLPNGKIASRQDSVMSLRAIGELMMQYQPLQNAFLSNIVNRIAQVIITSRLYENPWNMFKKGLMEFGETVEEIFVELAKPFQFNPEVAEDKVFKRVIPDVRAAFHAMNYQKFYKVTVSNDQLRQAFLSWQGITDLISKIINTLYTGANYDEFLVMKYMIARMALNGYIYPVTIPVIDATNARSVTTQMVGYGNNFQFMSDTYNAAGVRTYTDPSYLYTILTTDISALFDVEVLALSFNMSKAELLGRQVLVDGFGTIDMVRLGEIFADDPYTTYVPFTSDELTQLASIKALMVDESWFMIFDNLVNMTEIYNAEGLYWNYFYHVWKTFSTSPFANAVMFTTNTDNAATAITVTPDAATVSKGSKTQMSAVVTGTGFVNQRVHWDISGAETDTTITPDGQLIVGKGETQAMITVKATSLQTPDISGTATITIQGNGGD